MATGRYDPTVPEVHPTAVVAPGARLDRGVVIGPYAVIGEDVVIGAGTRVGPHVVIEDGVRIGRDNEISAACIIGCLPQDRHFLGEESYVVIGDRNRIREYASISRATGAGEATRIGHDSFVMSYVRIDHNVQIGNRVTIVGGTLLAGHVMVDDEAYIGGMSGVHQFVRIGRLAMIAAHSMVRQDCPPYLLAAGRPARSRGLNLVGLRRNGFTPAQRAVLRRAFHYLYQARLGLEEALEVLTAELGTDPLVVDLIEFVRASRDGHRGIVRWRPAPERRQASL